ncbi:MAG: NDP-sugar synthase [Candidatus Rokubacteria bacterium]|nr:NDP-sugar synthase [Candidatus Rokubacteria bacterium]
MDPAPRLMKGLQAVILAGGFGTRLRPLTLHRPKPVVPLLNHPFLHYQLALLAAHEVRDVILSVSHLPETIRAVMGDGSALGVRLRYAVEDEPLGTAGGVRNAADLVEGRVVVLNGDVLTDLDLSRMLATHEARRARATIYLTPVENPTAYGLVELDPEGRVRRFLEKPGWDEVTANTVNAGVYILERELLELVPKGRPYSMEREFFPDLLARGVPFFGHVDPAYWLDIGTTEKYLQAHRDLLEGRLRSPLRPRGRALGEGWVEPGTSIAESARLVGPVVLGAGCRVEAEARVGPAVVLGAGCVVGAGAHLEGAVLWESVSVGAGARLSGCLVARDCRIGAHARLTPGVVLGEGSVVTEHSRVAPGP